ncbi:MAG: hypothetical protein ACFFBS_06485 [Promethearchaeota archaeon]
MATDAENRKSASCYQNGENGYKLVEVLCSGCWSKFAGIYVPNDVNIERIRLLCHRCSEFEKTVIPV